MKSIIKGDGFAKKKAMDGGQTLPVSQATIYRIILTAHPEMQEGTLTNFKIQTHG